MNTTIFNIVKKDLYRTRYALAALVFVLLAKAILLGAAIRVYQLTTGAMIPSTISSMGGNFINRPYPVLPALRTGIAEFGYGFFFICDYFLVLMLILWVLTEDKPEDERSFWRSRPISGGQMFKAKAFYILLVSWGLQAVAQIIASAIAGETLSEYGTSLMLMTEYQAVFVPPIIIAATLWQNALLGFCVELLMFVAYAGFIDWLSERRGYVDMSQVSVALLVLLGVFTAGWMYIRRGRIKGFGLLAAGYCAILAVTWIANA